jgi:hypothetical protein
MSDPQLSPFYAAYAYAVRNLSDVRILDSRTHFLLLSAYIAAILTHPLIYHLPSVPHLSLATLKWPLYLSGK